MDEKDRKENAWALETLKQKMEAAKPKLRIEIPRELRQEFYDLFQEGKQHDGKRYAFWRWLADHFPQIEEPVGWALDFNPILNPAIVPSGMPTWEDIYRFLADIMTGTIEGAALKQAAQAILSRIPAPRQ